MSSPSPTQRQAADGKTQALQTQRVGKRRRLWARNEVAARGDAGYGASVSSLVIKDLESEASIEDGKKQGRIDGSQSRKDRWEPVQELGV